MPPSRPFTLQFQIGSIPVVVDPWFWLFTAMLGWSQKPELVIAWVAICFVSILIHELGHALMFRAFGVRSLVHLYTFGGLAIPERPVGRWQDLVVALAGPFAQFLLGGAVLLLSHFRPPDNPFGRECLVMALEVNFFWAIVNLAPILPLDGGHVLAALLGPSRRRTTLAISILFACLGMVAAWKLFGGGGEYIILLFAMFGLRSLQLLMVDQPIRAQKPPAPEPDAAARAWEALRKGDEREASRLAHLALAGAQTPEQLNAARDVLAWVSLADGEPRAALRQLEQISPKEAARAFSWAMAYDVAGLPEKAVEYAVTAVAAEKSDPAASMAVRLLTQAGRVAEAQQVIANHAWTSAVTREASEAAVHLANNDPLRAAERFESAFGQGRRPEHAVGAARAHGQAGQVERAAQWLRHALDAGFDGLEELAADPHLAPAVEQVRGAPKP